MIKYAMVVPEVADKDGQFSVGIRIIKQDEDQIAISGAGNLVFRASNGWSVLSTKCTDINVGGKMVGIMGVYGTGTYSHSIVCQHKANEATAYVESLEEAKRIEEEIVQAINDWILNG